MDHHHYLGFRRLAGSGLRSIATFRGTWLGLAARQNGASLLLKLRIQLIPFAHPRSQERRAFVVLFVFCTGYCLHGWKHERLRRRFLLFDPVPESIIDPGLPAAAIGTKIINHLSR